MKQTQACEVCLVEGTDQSIELKKKKKMRLFSYEFDSGFVYDEFSLKRNGFLYFYFLLRAWELPWTWAIVALTRVVLVDVKRILTVQLV